MSTLHQKAALRVRCPVHYPDSDGKPMGETPAHIQNMRWAIEPIFDRFAADPNVFVAANMFLYYVEGRPRKHVSPDVFVVMGIPKERVPDRRSYRTWEENGKGPDLVIEFTSKSTRKEDTETKMAIYRDILGVSEYFLFDPHDEYLRPRLQGYRLARGRYVRIKPVARRLPSQVLGLHLEAEGELLRFIDPLTGRRMLIPPELAEASQRAEEAREEEAARRRRAEQAARQAEAEQARAEQAARHAEAEKSRADEAKQQAEAEIARLKRELEALRRQTP